MMRPSRTSGPKDLTIKPFRLGEWIIEKGIASIAMAALVAIVLIFTFVFKESLVIFNPKMHGPETSMVEESSAGQESYGGASNAQESYGETSGKQESYGPVLDSQENTATEEEGQQSYGSAPSELSSSDSLVMGLVHTAPVVDPKERHSNEIKSLAGLEWQPVSNEPLYGVLPLFVGSLKIALIAVLLGAPIAILAALYTTTFAPRWAREWLKPAIELLAGFPSVVIGFFALVILASFFQNIFGWDYRLNALVGGMAMSLAVIPVIYTLSEDALSTVPNSYKDASLALGAAPWETAIYVVLPAALPGILAGVLLGVGRAIGETMIALMATGNAALMSFNVAEPVRTLSASIGAEMAEVVVGDMHYGVLFLLGALLFLVSFVLNFAVEFFVRQYLMKKFRGA